MMGDNVLAAASIEFEIPICKLRQHDRRQHIARARIGAIWCVRRVYPDMALAAIGELFDRHHTTILYALGQAESRRGVDSRYSAQLDSIVRRSLVEQLDRRDSEVASWLLAAGI